MSHVTPICQGTRGTLPDLTKHIAYFGQSQYCLHQKEIGIDTQKQLTESTRRVKQPAMRECRGQEWCSRGIEYFASVCCCDEILHSKLYAYIVGACISVCVHASLIKCIEKSMEDT